MTLPDKPARRPANPRFSSGPCAKRPGWTPDALGGAFLGRSHRSKEGKERLKLAITKTRASGINAAIWSAIAANFASRSPTTSVTGMASEPRRSHSGSWAPVPASGLGGLGKI